MSLDGATLYARGSGQSGEQPNGKAEQYQKAGTTTGTNIHPYDSGNILGTVPPGKPGIKLTDGTVQRASDLLANNQPLGNTLTSSNRPTTLGDPLVNVAQAASAGLSLAPQTE